MDPSASNAHVLTVLLQSPDDTLLARGLRTTIERAWQTNDWQLKIRYSAQAKARFVFQPNTMPHEEDDMIVMDANLDFQDPSTSIMIQHEFGHILGLKDCYVQFYDPTEKVFINYQLDTANIMCSRAGRVLPQHVAELKHAYLSTSDIGVPERGTSGP